MRTNTRQILISYRAGERLQAILLIVLILGLSSIVAPKYSMNSLIDPTELNETSETESAPSQEAEKEYSEYTYEGRRYFVKHKIQEITLQDHEIQWSEVLYFDIPTPPPES
ncbi:MAG: hypothetical protein AAFQ83_18025 [Bacteroidota bacterium]